ncbi:hypothetical protein ATO00_03265 [Loigolactobacillus coryniformis subsp. coryniformis]|uniref:Prophage pi3 protein 59 n=1 Tax=Loigolactobacillus coryniformis subsp. coryniformis KCTC 3167 = DSM 20001 TaxID=913848 RepID=A0A0R1F7Q9_9LACO|nr:DUF4352 domain-containing protein [Loigolactobacillus coryniformis]ATO55926.1 hypothetical protein LC20001_09930 [Loigolactobacillus coryniformis subsp. coryniformis KCTC 3167 = DSM 20001]KRK15761.1 prophage pi3 protein 59 [Loigolactobacillus coryniformis subsp. coryniformis KCTC 3167 = DSM 20001]OEH90562.1 hypothetical protein ATO00_03265 [Loigolactobacillus coryniformis subsp. coryniformis]
MKKLLGLLSVGIISLGLAGCGQQNKTKNKQEKALTVSVDKRTYDVRTSGNDDIYDTALVTGKTTPGAKVYVNDSGKEKAENWHGEDTADSNGLFKIKVYNGSEKVFHYVVYSKLKGKISKEVPISIKDHESSIDDQRASTYVSDDSSSKDSSTASTGNDTYSSVKNYNVNWSDNSWAGLNISIDKVDVGALKSPEETTDNAEANGIIRVHFTINNTQRDLSTYPNQATLQTSDGQQIDADLSDSDDIGGDFMQGTQKDGYVYFLVPTLDNASDITNIRLKFDGDYDTDNYEDDNSMHSFDTGIINLN